VGVFLISTALAAGFTIALDRDVPNSATPSPTVADIPTPEPRWIGVNVIGLDGTTQTHYRCLAEPGVAMDIDVITIKSGEAPVYLIQLCQDTRPGPY
jgi:hypothetical protein